MEAKSRLPRDRGYAVRLKCEALEAEVSRPGAPALSHCQQPLILSHREARRPSPATFPGEGERWVLASRRDPCARPRLGSVGRGGRPSPR